MLIEGCFCFEVAVRVRGSVRVQCVRACAVRALLGVSDVRQGAVKGDAVRDEDVEAVLAVGLVHPVAVRQGERLPLLAITCRTLWIHALYTPLLYIWSYICPVRYIKCTPNSCH